MSMDDVRSEPERDPEEYHQVRDEDEKRIAPVEQQYARDQKGPEQRSCDYRGSNGDPPRVDFPDRHFIHQEQR